MEKGNRRNEKINERNKRRIRIRGKKYNKKM